MRTQYIYSIFALAIAALLAGACKKTPDDPNIVTIINRLDEEVTLDIYADMQSYASNGTKVFSQQVGALSRIDIQPSTLQPGHTYYMDWHNASYSRHNWFNDAYRTTEPYYVTITPVKGNNAFDLDRDYGGMAKTTFLDDTDIVTEWKAVDVYLFSASTGYVSFWNTIDNYERYRMVKVTKDFTATYSYTDATTATITKQYPINVLPSQEAYIEFMDQDGTGQGSMIGGKLPTGQAPDYTSSSTDTVLALFPNSEYYFLMVKQ